MKGLEMSAESAEHFRVHGWMRVPSAFTSDEAAAMRDAVWRVIATRGLRKGEPSSWSEERPVHLQALKDDPVFHTVWSKQVIAAIDEVLEGQAWRKPKSCGALFIAFPSKSAWNIPASGCISMRITRAHSRRRRASRCMRCSAISPGAAAERKS